MSRESKWKPTNEPLTAQQALEKVMHFCAYRERCHKEVRQKLGGWNLTSDEIEWVIYKLIEDNFLNEERFAKAYCRGKFKFNSWGRQKIIRELKMRDISDYCIRKGMKEIDPEVYDEKLQELAQKKWNSLNGHEAIKQRKTAEHLIRKGYEYEGVWDVIRKLRT